MADLGRWLKGDYRVPGAPAEPTGAGEGEGEDEDADDGPLKWPIR